MSVDEKETSPTAIPVKEEATEEITKVEDGTAGEPTHNVELHRELKARHITMIGTLCSAMPRQTPANWSAIGGAIGTGLVYTPYAQSLDTI